MDAGLALDLIDHYPHAIIVEDAAGRLVAHNRAAARLLDELITVAPLPHVGCRIVGCRVPRGPLEGVCVHELALERGGPLAPVRVELPSGSRGDVASATVLALAPRRDLVVTELRRELSHLSEDHDGAPSSTAGSKLRLFVLGRTRVMYGDHVLEGRWIDNRAGHILKLLATERHRSVFSDEIISLLWPPASSPDVRGVRYFVHELREQLEPEGSPNPPSSFVHATRGGYALDSRHVWIDADEFEELVAAGLAARDNELAAKLIRRGVELYRGDFLADEPYAEWALHERDRLRDLASDGLRTLAGIETVAGDLARASASLTRLTELEPFDVDVHRELFALLLRRGRRSEALRRYDTLRRRMLSTFDEPLGFSLSQLL